MSRGRGRVRPGVRLILAGTAMLAAAACTGGTGGTGGDERPPPAPASETGDPTAGPVLAPEAAAEDPRFALVQQLLDDRAAAVRDGDLGAFMSTLAPRSLTDPGFRAQQRRWFGNLQQLPVGVLGYEVGGRALDDLELDVVRDDLPGAYVPAVITTLRLRGFDAGPVSRTGSVTVARTPRGYRVAAVDDASGGDDAALGAAPWDLVGLEVRRQRQEGDTLLLLDEGSAAAGDTLLPLLADGTARVQAAVPFGWDGAVVAYATGERQVIEAVNDIPGGDVAGVGALAFPVYQNLARSPIASFRFALNPEVLSSDALYLRRLVTHELTHVALGTRDDGAPTWVSEGAAEYVGALGLQPSETRIAITTVDRARALRSLLDDGRSAGLRLPPSRTFNGPESDWHYGLSWYAMEWIADERGPAAVWRLVRRMAAGGGTSDDEQETVLRRTVGVGEQELVRNAVDLILATYDR